MVRLGLICDPDFPTRIAKNLAEVLPDKLQHRGEDPASWSVEVVSDPLAAGRTSSEEILAATRDQLRHHGWDYAVCLTDLPLRRHKHPVLADIDTDHRVGAVSLPALGGLQPHRRARQMVLQALDDVGATTRQPPGGSQHELRSKLTEILAPVRRYTPQHDRIDIRYTATAGRGRVRLLTGMVRSNSPWQLVLGLSSALAAALATSAFGLTSSTVWQIGDLLGPWRKLVVTFGVIALMTTWLVLSHNLWEQRHRIGDREQRFLYNASTVLTLGIGVGCLYAALFLINLTATVFLIDAALLQSKLGHPTGFGSYLVLAWGATSMGVAAGALGSGLESDSAVRQAAYGYREEQRRAEQQELDRNARQQDR
ncbi:hypothetical protein DFQ14_102339 [Halopolyspora algeriensis]|uniref:5,10-methylene-tetrahydrofolate dehydrogenase n=1 Tax=Halopolyspora algeriensis TaxID=1500506 RepID=A0A368VXK3_9ACTN|nr:hypothetical protein [Halopolyspora algeriensis]RCW46037.1 hypothetical protein DFQ14_102339 [Halopolyspora algeriensis]TQM55449.1 hypothetical protein FHU43_0213 [Halopolyspora algeriensis]